MLYYDDIEKTFKKSPQYLIDLHCFIQEMKLWKSENPMRQELGVDYFALFNKQAYVETELDKVIDRYKSKFNSLQLKEVSVDNEKNIMYVVILLGLNQDLIELTLEV